ncbi:calcium-binding protein, partial [Sphingomonas beigongshangi]|uniref:calcium-binding protein n=1 Tax=Sphingomonas beigongshangi TaxID=2782540 RepID=UPI0023B0CAAA
IGGKGNDYLYGGRGSDTYRYTSGDGGDEIYEEGSSTDIDTLQLVDLNPGDVTFRRDGVHLYMTDTTTGQETKISNQWYSDAAYGIEQIKFADGTTWDRAAIQQAAWIRGSNADDRLYGSSDADILIGGKGNDYLYGGRGSDTYRYTSGDGGDEIYEEGSSTDIDTLQLVDLNPGDVTFRRDGVHLYMTDTTTGQETKISNQWYSDAAYGIEQIKFADGTTWDRAAIQQAAWIRGSNADDRLYGSSDADILIGGKGNDYLYGGRGSDTYRYTSGDGGDEI